LNPLQNESQKDLLLFIEFIFENIVENKTMMEVFEAFKNKK